MGQSTRLYTAGKGGAVSGSTPPGLTSLSVAATNAASLPATQTVLGTSETVITDPAIPTATALILSIPPGGPCEQEEMQLVASGYFNLGTSSTVNLRLYSGTSTTPGSNTLLKASGAVSAFSGKTNWRLKAILIYDTVSGQLTGTCEFQVNNTLVASAALANVVTAVSNTANPVLSFVLSVQYGTGGTQIISVKDFGINH